MRARIRQQIAARRLRRRDARRVVRIPDDGSLPTELADGDGRVAALQIVLAVTVGMAIFLGVLDFFFGWLLRNIVAQNVLFYILGIVVAAALLGAAYLIGQGEGV